MIDPLPDVPGYFRFLQMAEFEQGHPGSGRWVWARVYEWVFDLRCDDGAPQALPQGQTRD